MSAAVYWGAAVYRDSRALTLHTAPEEEPVTLAEAKMHCRITSSTEDALISAWIIAARGRAENYTHRRFVTQTWDWSMDAFPYYGVLEVPHAPLQSVTAITYIDGAGAEQTLDPAAYQVDAKSDPGRIAPAAGGTWMWVAVPSSTLNAVTVRFVCGYGEAVDVPQEIRAAMLLHIGDLNEHREAMLDAETYATRAWEALLSPFCLLEL